MAREKVGHALRGAIAQNNRKLPYDPVSAMISGAASGASDDSISFSSPQLKTLDKVPEKDRLLPRSSLKRSLPGRVPVSSFLSRSYALHSSEGLDGQAYKKLKAPSITNLKRYPETECDVKSQVAWEYSLQESNQVFDAYENSFSDDESEENSSTKKAALTSSFPNDLARSVAAVTSAAGVTKLTSPDSKPLQWRPPGASSLEDA
ncbi:MAG: hypothetical protein SGILL_006163, partial [Bacillariaceae sp.]